MKYSTLQEATQEPIKSDKEILLERLEYTISILKSILVPDVDEKVISDVKAEVISQMEKNNWSLTGNITAELQDARSFSFPTFGYNPPATSAAEAIDEINCNILQQVFFPTVSSKIQNKIKKSQCWFALDKLIFHLDEHPSITIAGDYKLSIEAADRLWYTITTEDIVTQLFSDEYFSLKSSKALILPEFQLFWTSLKYYALEFEKKLINTGGYSIQAPPPPACKDPVISSNFNFNNSFGHAIATKSISGPNNINFDISKSCIIYFAPPIDSPIQLINSFVPCISISQHNFTLNLISPADINGFTSGMQPIIENLYNEFKSLLDAIKEAPNAIKGKVFGKVPVGLIFLEDIV